MIAAIHGVTFDTGFRRILNAGEDEKVLTANTFSYLKNPAIYLGLGIFFSHELDSMLNHEWRVIPLLRALPDDIGTTVFVIAHGPLLAILIALLASSDSNVRSLTKLCMGLFLVFHGLLHVFFRGHHAYEFSSVLSNLLIFGGASLGVIYLILEWNDSRTRTN